MVLPSSVVNSWFTCHRRKASPSGGLRPRHAAGILTINLCSDTGFQNMKPLAQCNVDNFGAQYLHFRCGRQTAFPLAPHNSLPPYTQSSVLAWWLTFSQAGLSSLLTSAFLALPILYTGSNRCPPGSILYNLTTVSILPSILNEK